MNPTQSPQTTTSSTLIPTQSPTYKYEWLLFICYYNDINPEDYALYVTLLQYAQIMIEQILDTIEDIQPYSVNYNDGEINTESTWKRGGITDFKMCSIFENRELDSNCPTYKISKKNQKKSKYIAKGSFSVITNNNAIDDYKTHIINIITNEDFKNKFNDNMNNALNNVQNIQQRKLLQNGFNAILIEVIDTQISSNDSLDTADDNNNDSTVIIVIIVLLFLFVMIGIGIFIYFKKFRNISKNKTRTDTEGDMQNHVEMNNYNKVVQMSPLPNYNKQKTNENNEGAMEVTKNIIISGSNKLQKHRMDNDIVNEINQSYETNVYLDRNKSNGLDNIMNEIDNENEYDGNIHKDIISAVNNTAGGPIETPGSLPPPPARKRTDTGHNNDNDNIFKMNIKNEDEDSLDEIQHKYLHEEINKKEDDEDEEDNIGIINDINNIND
eukprot:265158_1